MIKVHASGYIWTNPDFEYPQKSVSFEPHMHNVNQLVQEMFHICTVSGVQSEKSFKQWDSFILYKICF